MAHPDSTFRTYPIERLTALVDGLDTLQELDLQEGVNTQGEPAEADDLWMMEDGEWHPVSTLGSEEGWEDEDDQQDDNPMEVDANHTINGNDAVDLDAMDIDVNGLGDPGPSPPMISPSSPSQDTIWSELAEGAAVTNNIPVDGIGKATHMIYSPPSTTPSSPRRGSVQPPPTNGTGSVSSLSKEYVFKDRMEKYGGASNGVAIVNGIAMSAPVEEPPWKRFDILSSAPADHAFYSEPPAQPGKSFMTRLNREYRALANSLPGVCHLSEPAHGAAR